MLDLTAFKLVDGKYNHLFCAHEAAFRVRSVK